MTGTVFKTPNSKKTYKIIGPHKMFEEVWLCYPADKDEPHKPNLIECFSTEFILKNKDNE